MNGNIVPQVVLLFPFLKPTHAGPHSATWFENSQDLGGRLFLLRQEGVLSECGELPGTESEWSRPSASKLRQGSPLCILLCYMATGCWSPKCAFVWKCGTVPQIHQNWLFLVAYPIFKHCHIHYSLVNYQCFIVKSPFNLWFPMTRGCPCLGQHPEELLATVLLAVSTLLDASWPMDE